MACNLFLLLAFIALGICFINAVPNSSRIISGQDAVVGQFPYQISLQREGGEHVCGGSILNERYIITAAHCVVVQDGIEAYPARFYQVRVGSIRRSMGGELVKLKRVIVNKSYGNFKNDLALLELEQPLKWSDNVQAIEMFTEEVPNGADIIISGWGINENILFPQRLQWQTLKSISTEECAEFTPLASDSLICLSHPIGNGACSGDSGGPAAYNGKLVGVLAFTNGGCASKYPDAYEKVSYHRKWILEHMNL